MSLWWRLWSQLVVNLTQVYKATKKTDSEASAQP